MKTPPQILFDSGENSLSYFEKLLKSVETEGVKSITFLIAAHYPHTQASMNGFLKKIPVPVSGGVFPEIIYNNHYYSGGMLALLWFDDARIHTFYDASCLDSELYQQQSPMHHGAEHMASLVFSNTKTRAAEAALDALYYRNGQSTQYSGGGAAYYGGCDKPSIVTKDGLVSDAMQIVCLPYEQVTRVGHGWSVLSGPHLVTESEENRVKALDYQAIKPYFQSLIRNSAGEEAANITFEEMLREFPVGIQPYDEEMIVRDILGYENDEMEFIGDIPEFSSIYILSGKKDSLLEYVKNNTGIFRDNTKTKPDLSLIFSCSGRRAHMGDKSAEELSILSDNLDNINRVVGVSSLGEIASNTAGLARLHSMSLAVSGLWV